MLKSQEMRKLAPEMDPLRIAGRNDESPLIHDIDREREDLHRPADYLMRERVVELHCLSIPFVDRVPGVRHHRDHPLKIPHHQDKRGGDR